MTKTFSNNILRDMTSEEQADYDNRISTELPKVKEQKLEQVRLIRNQKLAETDYLGVSDNTMSSDWVAKRKSWRDIPQDFTTESQYDLLLARDSDGELTHTIWSKPS